MTYFNIFDFWKNVKIGLRPAGKIYIVCALSHNGRICSYESATSTYFDSEEPPLVQYFVWLSLHEKLILLTHLHPVLLGT